MNSLLISHRDSALLVAQCPVEGVKGEKKKLAFVQYFISFHSIIYLRR